MQVNDRLRVAWDDRPTGGGPNGQSVHGTVVDWVESEGREAQLDPLIWLDSPIVGSGDPDGEVVGSYLTLSTRYVGQDWSGSNNTVHVTLLDSDPRLGAPRRAWVASHGGWFAES